MILDIPQLTMYLPALFISFALLIIGITILTNIIFFPRLQNDWPEEQPKVSVLIPARDESNVIFQTVMQALAQTYRAIELIVLDDRSSDNTAELAMQAAGPDERFHLLRGEPLPQGWLGKNWACHQLSQAANGELLLFLDADVQLQPAALAAIVTHMSRKNAELLTVWPTQLTTSWGERLVVPLIAFAIMGYLPILPVHYTPWSAFAAANGQCLLFTRSAYQQIGGHAAVRNNVVEDVALSRQVKTIVLPKQSAAKSKELWHVFGRIRHYFRSPLSMSDGNRIVSCQMYPGGWLQARNGFAKNILAGHGNQPVILLVSTIFHWLIFVIPWFWWFAGGSWWALGLGLSGLLLRAITAAFTNQRIFDALLMPLSVVLMTDITLHAIIWHYTGSATWKGRPLRIDN